MYFLSEICQNSNVLSVIRFVMMLVDVLCFVIPIFLIVMISIDFLKSVIANSADDMKKSSSMVLKRIISTMAIFLVPSIVTFTMTLLGDIGVEYANCITNATEDKINYFRALEEEQKNSQNNNSNVASNSNSSSSNPSSSTPSASDPTPSGTAAANTSVNFKLDKKTVVLGHYTSKVHKYKIVIRDSNGNQLDNNNFTFSSSNPGIASVTDAGKIVSNFGGNATITVASKIDASKVQEIKVVVIQSLYTRVTVSKKVTGTSLLTGKKVTLKAGTKGIYNGLGRKKDDSGKISGSLVGDTILVNKDYISLDVGNVKPYKYYISDVYSDAVAEDFINSFGFDSDTKYLFWINQGAQTAYMFRGSKGNWKLYKKFSINTGDSSLIIHGSSAVTGVHFDYTVGRLQSVSGYTYKVIWKKTAKGSTNPWHEYGDGKRYPGSHGCTRFQSKDIKYLISIHSKIQGSRIIDF